MQVLAAGVLALAAAAPVSAQGTGSTSTTTTILIPPTTTLDPGVDVTGGGRYRGGFLAGFDLFTFDLVSPAVLVAETSNGKGLCDADTILRLEQGGVVLASDDDSGPGQCSKITFRLNDPGAYELVVSGFGGSGAPEYYLTVEFVQTTCGNDIVELLEECDDGNADDGDCCSSGCTRNADGTPCDNARTCDGEDSCMAGACTQHSLSPCPGADGDADCAESCSDSEPGCTFPDQPSSVCDDGTYCNGADRCHQGTCSGHAGNPCDGADGDHDCTETCDEATDTCSAADPNGSPCDDTRFCNAADECSAGACGVHEGNPCPGPDGDADCSESCSESRDSCTANDPGGSSCDDGLYCNGTDTCASGQCTVHAGSPCPGSDGDGNCSESCNEAGDNCSAADPAASPCDDGVFCNGTDTCSAGACSVHAGGPCPGPDGDSNCAESCNETGDTCTGADTNGSPCDDGLFCNGADSCLNGACSVHAGSPCPGPDGDSNCAESCNETADTCAASDPNGSACSDGQFCNGADTCQSGACTGHAGSPCPGPDGDGNCAESCSESSDACTANDPNGSTCTDSVFCNGADSCASGACSGHAGNPCPGPDGDSNCAESCSESGDSCSAADPDASACNDGLFCNGADTCQGGTCSGHGGDPCPGVDGDGDCSEGCNEVADACTTNDPNESPCGDGVFCNGADTCSGGACSVHAGNPCPGPDGDGNCAESCNEGADACSAADSNGIPCDDGVFCNGADTCQNGACSVHAGSPCAGADGDGNCAESCNETTDACTASDANGSACNDGLFCNGADTCQGGACSVHAGDPCPGTDGDSDCSELCHEDTDACTANDPNGSSCSDGLFCNGADTCHNGSCTGHEGDPCTGADGDGNCAESCNESGDACTAADPNGSACNDGLFCNGADTCQAGSCSTHAGSPCPGVDGDGNCTESCSEAADACTASDPNGSSCNDGLFCNGADSCAGGNCNGHAGDPCNGADGDGNCAESCNEASDACTASDPNGSACNDGLFCNGLDTCVTGTCSAHAGDPCPGADGDGSCAESCSEGADACTATDPNGSSCDDGLYCNGADTCSGGACSGHAGNPCTGADGDGDCAESCSEASDACTGSDANGSPCEDGLACNGTDSCLNGGCTMHSGSPCPGGDGDGDCSESCSDSTGGCSGPDPDGTPCDDGIYCNGTDRCSGGTCSVHLGNPCPGADGDADCSESCSEADDSCTAADGDGAPCSDGSFCNGADTCASGECAVHAGNPCPGPDGDGNCAESCNEASDACNAGDTNGSPCSDGLYCNGADSCSAGACSQHAGNPCPGADGDSNCSESCSEASDSCTAADPNGAGCDDALYCNGADSCSGGSCSQHAGNPCVGADGDINCAESCSEAGENCIAADPGGSPCDDGVFCNGDDSCSSGSCSLHAGDPCPGPDDDGNCRESCSEAADACNAADPGGAPCNDGQYCNGEDTCSGGSCSQHAGNPCSGVDGDSDCSESCGEATDTCNAADPDGSACNDGLYCNGADSCSSGACSQHAGSPCAGADGDANCAESCGEANDTCNAADPNGSPCDDGVYCNGNDSCVSGSCSTHAGNPCPGADGDGNCAETCSEASDACNAADPDGSDCSDGVFCDGADECLGGSCSEHTGDPCSSGDGDGDCSESCNEDADACTANDPGGSACDDGDRCTTDDACDGGGSCASDEQVDCDDADECTTDACSLTGELCTHGAIANCPPSTTTTTVPPFTCGDANGDDNLSAGDALAILQSAVGGTKCDGLACICDVNGSGGITTADALLALRSAVNLPVVLACDC